MEKYFLKGVGGQLSVEEDFIVIKPKGALGFMTHGLKGEKRIPIRSISAVQLKKGTIATSGYIQFSFGGGKENKGGLWDATSDENTILFPKKKNALALEIRSYIEERLMSYVNPIAGTPTPVSAADEILKYANLLDQGHITEEEFNQKKRSLLGL
jgi:hypothetical protein